MDDMITIRQAVVTDVVDIIRHKQVVLQENASFMGRTAKEYQPTIEHELARIRKHQNETGIMLVAIHRDEVIGMLTFSRPSRPHYSHNGMFGMSIQERYTNQGLGHKLLNELLIFANNDPAIEKVSLEVYAHNERAIALYKRLGFTVEGQKPRHRKESDGSYVEDVLMSKIVT
ncbi:GNAT family N-acetyltransferase [Geomicrobium sediminis]|uniref:RimJ/RimL family protein N-acetyltransferase n=1 Tax=Geomicrobium sediminis TaxID=1347788 RepID=A0ABS2PB49_9BACL|nr:N-acetyltransferase [Geomicrobium sediminis]MBM7632576.1 RimJ/RimL family protein N-acetyltransferase [Geomicrobium sediminis]